METADTFADKSSPLYIKKWIDYSQNYGIIYQLNDGTVGVQFNDKSVITSDPLQSNFL